MRTALDPAPSTLVALGVAWVVLLVLLSVASLGLVEYVVGLLWAVLLIYLAAAIVYGVAREEDTAVKRWGLRALEAPRPVVIGLIVTWVVLSIVLPIADLGGITFLLGFAWALLLMYLIAFAIQDYARE